MRAHELDCIHGVGHSGDIHGCDGCCSIIADPVRNQERERFARIANTMLDKETAEDIIFLVNDYNVL